MKLRLIPVILTAAITSAATFLVAEKFHDDLPFVHQNKPQLPVNYASFDGSATTVKSLPPVDFQAPAEAAVKAVVHIKTQTKAKTITARDPFFNDDFFGNLFGQRQYYIPPQMGSGSGVVISPDGYIVTNYHVVAGTEKVTVTFNDRYTTEAEVIGKDASTDIAVLKVDEKDLPYMEFGNSDDVKLGQWVLAVGYPLTLDATVTAGIVSAKSRAIGINRTQSRRAIESFIQTDAAVNPGNSGGALVNTSGQLIGINSAIASPTGSYAGYSYAIPSNIVKKVVSDLMKFGSVHRAYLGIQLLDRPTASPEQLQQLGIDREEGVYVYDVVTNGGAYKAGIRKGDFITQINDVNIRTEPELLEQVARYNPGDNVSVTYTRNGHSNTVMVELKNEAGTTSVLKTPEGVRILGASFRPLTPNEKSSYGVSGGMAITDVGNGFLAKRTEIKKGFVVLSVNNKKISGEDDLIQELQKNDKVQIAGFYPGNRGMYYFSLNNIDEAITE